MRPSNGQSVELPTSQSGKDTARPLSASKPGLHLYAETKASRLRYIASKALPKTNVTPSASLAESSSQCSLACYTKENLQAFGFRCTLDPCPELACRTSDGKCHWKKDLSDVNQCINSNNASDADPIADAVAKAAEDTVGTDSTWTPQSDSGTASGEQQCTPTTTTCGNGTDPCLAAAGLCQLPQCPSLQDSTNPTTNAPFTCDEYCTMHSDLPRACCLQACRCCPGNV